MRLIAALAPLLLSPLCLSQEAAQQPPAATKTDLAELKELVLRNLKEPKASTHANGMPDPRGLHRSLAFACGWTEPDFIPPLLAILDDVPEHRFQAAACLLRYRKAELDRRVATHAKHVENLAGGCVVDNWSIQALMDHYAQHRSLPGQVRAADIDENLLLMQNGDAPSRLNAWTALASHGWFAPWKEYGVDAATLWPLTKKRVVSSALLNPAVGAERARTFMSIVRKLPECASESRLIAALLWRLGCDEEAPACRALLKDTLVEFAERTECPDEASYPVSLICHRPVFENLELYRRLLVRPSGDLRRFGWDAVIHLDRDESLQMIRECWKDPGKDFLKDACYLFSSIESLGRKQTSHRQAWLDLLLEIQPKVPFTSYSYPEWINAVASMAGVNFGFNGAMIPMGFNQDAARKTTKAILDWNAGGRRR